MKKRILALALAGTTAFSVFGAAISANAIDWPSTDTKYDVDAYVSLEPVAKEITSTKATSNTTYYLTDNNTVPPTVVAYGGQSDQYKTVDEYIYGEYDLKEEYVAQKGITFEPTAETVLTTEYRKIDLVFVEDSSGTYIREKNGYNIESNVKAQLAGSYYIDSTALVGNYGNLNGITIYYYEENAADAVYFGLNDHPGEITCEEYEVKPADNLSLSVDAEGEVTAVGLPVTNVTNRKNVYSYKGGTYTYEGLINELKKDYPDNKYTFTPASGYNAIDGADVGNTTITADQYEALDKYDDIEPNIDKGSNSTPDGAASVTVGKTINDVSPEDYTEWTFNGDMTGEVSIYPFKVTSELAYDKDGNVYINNVKESIPTIYAFDFIPETNPDTTPSNIAYYWNKKDVTGTADAIGNHTMSAETGRGTGVGIRADVIADWEDFMEELAISDKWGYSEGFEDFCDNYEDMFYSDPVFSPWTGEIVGEVDVDLYNIRGLLQDIWNLHESADYEQANTSELLYLMQQYDKYIGNYIDKAEVASDEWGDLLLSILDAATEEDFRNAPEYRKYQNEVEDLRDAYELATTVNMIRKAEVGMYNLLTTRNSQFRASATPDKATLNSTMEDLYFNVGTAPTEYSVLPSTLSTNNVDYSNYNYYVAALKVSDSWAGLITDNLYFTNTLSRGYYSLYPMADYEQANNPNEVYPGNTTDDARGVNGNSKGNYYENGSSTDEYQWFWNVYQLAANMSAKNTKQGSVDAVNDALNDAVAELAVTTTPNSTEVGAVEDALEEYAGKIDTDYNEGYYAKYTQATDYAENVAEGKWQTRIAAMVAGVAGEALTYQGTQVTITKNDMKTVETAIKNGETALKAIKEDPDYNAAQVNALNKAIDQAQYLVDLYEGTYSTKKDDQSVNKNYSRLVGDKDQMVKSDLTAAIEAIDAAINYSEIIMGWSKNDAGKWMYGTEEGYLNNGWNKIGSVWYYFNADNTAKQSEWFKENGKWYWLNSNCGAAYGWAKVDGKWYYFNGDNSMRTGWVKVEGNWYYLASSGAMVTGWCEVDGKWYYFSKNENALGQMEYNTTIDGYKLGADGAWIK